MGKKTAGGFYAVGKGRQVGIFNTWAECEANVKGYPDAKYKKFSTSTEAQSFVDQWRTKIGNPGKVHQLAPSQKSQSDPSSAPPTGSNFGKINAAPSKPEQEGPPLTSEDKLNRIIKSSKRRIEKSTELLESPMNRNATKRLRRDSPFLRMQTDSPCQRMQTDSPQTMEVGSPAGDKAYLPFIVDADDFVNVYTDGACLGNGTVNSKAGVGVWFGDNHPLNISEPVIGPPTNNTAEIQAARLAIEVAVQAGFEKLRINTDSAFLIQCVTCYMHKWKTNGWKLTTGGDVKNRVELEKLDRAQQNILVQWTKVPAHSGLHGNEMADKLASEGAERY